MIALVEAGLFVGLGFGASSVHLLMLRRAVVGVRQSGAGEARRAITRGLPLRLLLMSLFLAAATVCGLSACLWWVLGFAIGRWLGCVRALAHPRPFGLVDERG